MSTLAIIATVVGVYGVVGIFGYAICKTAGEADRAIETMFEEELNESKV